MDNDKQEVLNNLISSIQEKLNSDTAEKIKSEDNNNNLSSLLNNLNSNTSSDNSDSSFDPNMILKIQSIISKLNSSSAQKNLLLSLKPFLRKSRQDKMENYITILNVISVLESFIPFIEFDGISPL